MIERHSDGGYVPMRVVARMSEPIVYLGDLLHLDGPLAYAAYHDLDEATRKTIPPVDTAAFPVDLDLPLSRWSAPAPAGCDDRLLKSRNGLRRGLRGPEAGEAGADRRIWGWCASAADESWAGRGKLEVRKRPELGKMSRYTDAKSANIGAGHMKAYDLALPTVIAAEVVWWAHGDPEKVRALLAAHVGSLGKKRSIGNGTVMEWTVEPCDKDRSIVWGGKATRRLPSTTQVEGAPGYGAIRPPYYHSTRVVESVEPCR